MSGQPGGSHSVATGRKKLEEAQTILADVLAQVARVKLTEQERHLLFCTGDVAGKLKKKAKQKNLAVEADQQLKVLYKQTSALVTKLQNIFDEQPSGLYAEIAKLRQKNWAQEVRREEERFREIVGSNRALSAALAASAWRSRTNAQKIRVRQAELEHNMAKICVQVLDQLRSAQRARLQAAIYEYQAAATQRDLARLETWKFRQRGGDVRALSPSDVELVSREVWRCFRDIVFFSKYYEGTDHARTFREFLSQAHGKHLTDSGIWKPNAIQEVIKKLEVANALADRIIQRGHKLILNKSIDPQKPGKLAVEPGLRLTIKEIRQFGRIVSYSGGRYYSVLVELVPFDNNVSKVYENPWPIGFPPLEANGAKALDLQHPLSSRPRVRTFLPEDPSSSRSRLLGVAVVARNFTYLGNADLGQILFRHLGDGFITITIKVRENVHKRVVSVHWRQCGDGKSLKSLKFDDDLNKRNYHIRLNSYGRGVLSRIHVSSFFANVKKNNPEAMEQLINQAIERRLGKKLVERSHYYMSPACGTYELLIPTGFDKADPNGELVFYFECLSK